MATLDNFDANAVEPSAPYEPLPGGKYLVAITKSAIKPAKKGGGEYLEFALTVLEGEYQNRVLWARLNLKNASDIAVKIARAELSAICRAVGVMTPKDSTDLHNLPLVVTVRLTERKDNGELTNEIKGYEPKGASLLPTPGQQADENVPPWKRG